MLGNCNLRNLWIKLCEMIKPWDQIRKHYATSGNAFPGMHELVCQIESSRYKDGLFAWTSMWDLCIVQTPVTYPYDGPLLKISPISDGQIEFRYLDTPVKDKQWHRVVESAAAFARLESFIKQLHWFTS